MIGMPQPLINELKRYAKCFGDFIMDCTDNTVTIYADSKPIITGTYDEVYDELVIFNNSYINEVNVNLDIIEEFEVTNYATTISKQN